MIKTDTDKDRLYKMLSESLDNNKEIMIKVNDSINELNISIVTLEAKVDNINTEPNQTLIKALVVAAIIFAVIALAGIGSNIAFDIAGYSLQLTN